MMGDTDGDTRATMHTGRPLICVVVNPPKPHTTAAVRSLLEGELHEVGYAEPAWLEMNVSEPDTIQAHLTLTVGASPVVAAGGDGTVCLVATGLASTNTQMGIVPLDTTNLAVRNLEMPAGDARTAARVVAYGVSPLADPVWVRTKPWSDPDALPGPTSPGSPRGRADSASSTPLIGRATVTPPDSPPTPADPADPRQLLVGAARVVRTIQRVTRRPHQRTRPTLGDKHTCMVVAGIRFDTELVAFTRPAPKARIGWGAYAPTVMENLGSLRVDLVLSLLDEVGARRVKRLWTRNLLVANSSRPPTGVTLLPQTRTDDGLFNVAAIDTVVGLVGWSSPVRQMLLPYAAYYSESGRSLGRVMLRRGGEVAVQLSAPTLVEVDGDLLAPTQGMRVRTDPGALFVRRPAA